MPELHTASFSAYSRWIIMRQIRNSSIFSMIALTLFVALFVFFIYTFLHEAGHAVVGLLFGQALTEFDVSFWHFSAHVGMAGGELTRSQLAIQSAAGAGMPLLVWAICISLVPRKASFTVEVLKLLSSMNVVNTLLVWIILPILLLWEKAPADDVTNFLRYSQLPPMLVMFAAITLYMCGWSLFLSKIDGLRNQFLLFRTTDHKVLTAGTLRIVSVMIAIMLLGVMTTFLLNHSAAKGALSKFSPPQDFEAVAEIDLSSQRYSGETLAEFTLAEPGSVGVFIAVRRINTSYFDLSLIGPGGYRSVILHGEGYRADQDGGLWEENLSPGTYRVTLTSNQSPGMAAIFLKIH